MSVNKAILLGRLGKDPEIRHTPSGQAVTSFSLATARRWADKDGQRQEATTWHNIVAWGRQAEVIAEYLKKGQQVYIEGRIDNRSYDDKAGNKKYISEVVVEAFRFIGSKQEGDAPTGAAEPSQPPAEDGDDLPF